MSDSNNINHFMKALRLEVLRVEATSPKEHRAELGSLFREAMDTTIEELTKGAEVQEFYFLTLANFIVLSAEEGYNREEIASFGAQFRELAREYSEEE